jgi:hypothetical protein
MDSLDAGVAGVVIPRFARNRSRGPSFDPESLLRRAKAVDSQRRGITRFAAAI